MKENLLILGAGQYGMVARDIALAMGSFERIDFLDDNKDIAIGALQEYSKFVAGYQKAIVALGNPADRMDWLRKLKKAGFSPAKLIHPTAVISPGAILEPGTVVEPMAVVHHEAVVREGCILSAGAVVDHNCILEKGCHVGCNASVSAGTALPPQTKVANNTTFQKK